VLGMRHATYVLVKKANDTHTRALLVCFYSYSVVGLEQASRSQVIQEVEFPDKVRSGLKMAVDVAVPCVVRF